MNIKTSLTQADYKAFVQYVTRSVSAAKGDRVVRVFIGITAGLGIGLALSLTRLSLSSSTSIVFLCGGLAGAFIAMAVVSDISRRQLQRMKPLDDGFILGSQEVSLEDEGVRQRSGHHQSIFQWSLVRAGVTDQHVFIMVDRVAGIIVPKRAFPTDAERDLFVGEIARLSGKVAA